MQNLYLQPVSKTSQKYDSFFTSFAYPHTAGLIHNSKVRISVAPLFAFHFGGQCQHMQTKLPQHAAGPT